ncbi:MAG: hypothetical protein RQ752_15685, partial [Thermohalobaculum sp.]|nr:hypothetical protein [Thermohalobaculum sp.]
MTTASAGAPCAGAVSGAAGDPPRARREGRAEALVVAAFPPAGAAGALGAGAAASFALLGARVTTVAVAGSGGEAQHRLDFATAMGVRAVERALAGRRVAVLLIDPGLLRFRKPRR